MSDVRKKHNHYHKQVTGMDFIDVYRVLQLFNVTDPCLQHAVKKLLVAGGRGGGKDISKDIQESIDSLVRWQEMRQEEGRAEFEFNSVKVDDPSLLPLLGVQVLDWPRLLHLKSLLSYELFDDGIAFYDACVQLVEHFHKKYDSKVFPINAPVCSVEDWDKFSARWVEVIKNYPYPFGTVHDASGARAAFDKTREWHYGSRQ